MKPTLLYIRKYIDQNYKNHISIKNGIKKQEKQIAGSNQFQKIFSQKLAFQRNDIKKRQFYFKNPKSFNQLKQIIQRSDNKIAKAKPQIQFKQRKHQSSKFKYKQGRQTNDYKEQESQAIINKQQNGIQQHQQQVKFVISPPITKKNTHVSQVQQQQNQFFQKNKHSTQNINITMNKESSQNSNLDVTTQQDLNAFIQENVPTDHSRIICKSINKIGYNTLFDYLNQMKKVSQIKNVTIKEAFYYPLNCMKSDSVQYKVFEEITKQQKIEFLQKLNHYRKQIQVQQNFSIRSLQIQSENIRFNTSRKFKSKFIKSNSNHNLKSKQSSEPMKQKFILEYQNIVMCNCSTKRFFTYKIKHTHNYTSFFKYTSIVLQDPLIKQKSNDKSEVQNYFARQKQLIENRIYFCSLINTSMNIKECFFWIGKPLQYYKRHYLIQLIDQFLMQIDGIDLFPTEKIYIVDYHGRTSFIQKKLLIKYHQMIELKNSLESRSKNSRTRISKRVSFNLSNKMDNNKMKQNVQTSDTFFGLLSHSTQFNQSLFYRKQRNNISTRGMFKMIYDQNIV